MESDGSLLDGASLANEWSLPVLPEGVNNNSSLALVARECYYSYTLISAALCAEIISTVH